ncbi:DUF421 domain-containing protein [Lactobacillus sp. DCY120]|uniref:DUF421 domain-containing protein n=1 Tax=Bombilactobacillus apium TaxID=2675299 RepID=A0A850RA33_9LACO|nr:DUF421 domain-containing protein [Bombilactobacillus apium]NVY95688.1 DUF421 domain-containing protein [Bombilactobacillus apium]
MSFYLNTFLKLLMGFITMIIQINLLGKSNLAPSNVIDQIQNFVLGGIIGGVLYNQEISVIQFLIVLIIWTLVVFTTKFLTNHNSLIKQFVDGKPTVIISKGQVFPHQAVRNGLSAHDLAFKLRQAGVNDLNEIDRAIWEQNGQLTLTLKTDSELQFPVIMDGEVDQLALEYTQKTEDWILNQVEKQNLNLSDIYIAYVEDDHLKVCTYGKR